MPGPTQLIALAVTDPSTLCVCPTHLRLGRLADSREWPSVAGTSLPRDFRLVAAAAAKDRRNIFCADRTSCSRITLSADCLTLPPITLFLQPCPSFSTTTTTIFTSAYPALTRQDSLIAQNHLVRAAQYLQNASAPPPFENLADNCSQGRASIMHRSASRASGPRIRRTACLGI